MAMDQRLADRYQAAAIDPRMVPLELRWKGVAAATKQLSIEAIADLVRLAASRQSTQAEVRTKFQQHFKDADTAFLLEGNDQELSLLAAATLSNSLSTESRVSDLVALLIRSSQFAEWTYVLPDVAAESEAYLTNRSVSARRVDRPAASLDSKSAIWKKTVETVEQEATAAGQPQFGTWIGKLGAVHLAETGPLASVLTSLVDFTARADAIHAEELNILWWLFADYSKYLDRAWESVDVKNSVSLVAALELFELTTIVPAPYSSKAFLAKVLKGAGLVDGSEVVPGEAIAQAPKGWHERAAAAKSFGDLTPLLTAVTTFDAEDDGWIRRAERTSGVSLRDARDPLVLGWQMLTELQAAKVGASA